MLTGQFIPIGLTGFGFSARITLTTRKGSITFDDAGVITDPFTTPHSAEVLTITSGTGDYGNASGHVFITGDYVPPFDPITQQFYQTADQGFGALSGQICLP